MLPALLGAAIPGIIGGIGKLIGGQRSTDTSSGISGMNPQLLGGLIGAGRDILSMGFQGITNRINRQREDTAVQRRVADLESAGINKVFAAGSAAQSATQQAPQSRINPLESSNMALQLLQQKADISRTKAEEDYIRMQARGQHLENVYSSETLGARSGRVALQYAFDKATQEDRIQQIIQDLKGTRTKNTILQIEREYKKVGLAEARFDFRQKKEAVQAVVAKTGMSPAAAEAFLKYVMYMTAQYNREWYKQPGKPGVLPINSGLDMLSRNAAIMAGAGGDAVDQLSNKMDAPDSVLGAIWDLISNPKHLKGTIENILRGSHGASGKY